MNAGIEVKDLVLTIEKQVPGELRTNARKIREFVAERIKDFIPENYYDDPERAKKDRAVLNAAAADLNGRRLALEREFMSPFDEPKSDLNAAVTMLKEGAAKLGEVWDAVVETQKAEKRRDIEDYFATKNFALVPLARIFDEKWLNKTVHMKDVQAQLSDRIQKIYGDIEVIEGLPYEKQDIEDTKAQYLDTLDIGGALATAKRLKENRDRLAAEAAQRQERKHDEHLEEQAHEIAVDAVREAKAEPVIKEALDALEMPVQDTIMEYTLRFRGTRSQLFALRKYMTDQGIEYEKVEGAA